MVMGGLGANHALFMERETTSSRSVSLQGVFDCSQVFSDTRPSTLRSRISSISSTDAPSIPSPDISGETQHDNVENGACLRTSRGAVFPSMLSESNNISRPNAFVGARKNSPKPDTMCENSGRTLLPRHVAANVSLATGGPTVSAGGDVGDVGINIGDSGRQNLAVFLQRLECHGISHCDPGDCHTDAKAARCTGRNS